MPLPAVLGSVLSGAGRVAAGAARGAITAGSAVSRTEAFQALKKSAIEKAPRAIFNAAGGNKIPLLDAVFGGIDGRRLKRRAEAEKKAEADRKKLEDKQKTSSEQSEQKKNSQEKGLEKSKRASEKAKEAGEANARRQEKAHQEGVASLEKGQTGLLQKISDDIHEMKGLLAGQGKVTAGGEGGGGGFGSAIASVLGAALGLAPGKFLGKAGSAIAKLGRGLGRGALRLGGFAAKHIGGLARGAGNLVSNAFPTVARYAGTAGRSVLNIGRAGLSAAGGLLTAGRGALGTVLDAGKSLGAKALAGAGVATATAAGADALAAGAKSVGKEAAEKIVAKEGVEAGGKTLAKLGAKTVGKSLVKKIPIVGLLAGLGFAAYRAAKGDWAGAGMEVASGAAGTIPGIGTAASVGIDLALAKRDYDQETAALEGGNPEEVAEKVAPDFSNVQGGASSANLAPVAAPTALAEAKSSTASPIEQLASTMNTMLGLMMDEKQGIYVRMAKDVLSQQPITMGEGAQLPRRPIQQRTVEDAAKEMQQAQPTFSRRPNAASMVRGSTDALGSSKDAMALSIYDAARQAGFSHDGAKVLVGEVGRENGLNSDLVFGSHIDPANGARNAGMLSFQGERRDNLMKFLSQVPGALDDQGNMNKNQANLNGQLAFIRQEMESGRNKGLAQTLSSDNIDTNAAADQLGRNYIKWRIDDPRYRDSGIRNRNAFQSRLDSALAARGTTPGTVSPMTPASVVSADLMAQTQQAIDQGVKYGFGSKNTRTGKIDCSGWVAQINKNLIGDIANQGESMAGSKKAERLFEGGAAGIVENIANVTGKVMGNSELTADSLREGMIIGEDNGEKGWDKGRYNGIDHITQVVKDPTTGQLMISQSSGGKGVNLMPASDYLDAKNARGTKLFGVDTNAALDQLTAGEWSQRASGLQQEGPRYAGAIQQSKAELAQVEQEAAQPVVVVAPAGDGGGKPMQGAQGGAGLTAPMTTRNNDSSIRRLTDNFMGHSMPIA